MYQTIGEFLKQVRNERKFSIDDVARATRIRPKYIEALENNRFDALPSSVHGKGFLRSYADFLDLPHEHLLKAWDTGMIDPAVFQPENEPGQPRTAEMPSKDPVTNMPISAPIVDALPDQPAVATNAQSQPPLKVGKKRSDGQVSSESFHIFTQIGEKLRAQREALDLSLDDIEQYTHIRLFYLQAIEAGRLGDLPSPVQAKGMTENYARFLDVDTNQIMLQFADGLQAQRVERSGVSAISSRKKKKGLDKPSALKRFLTPDLLVGSVVIIALVVFAIWSTSQIITKRNEAAQATIPGISEMLAATSSPTIEMSTSETPGANTSQTTIESEAVVTATAPEGTISQTNTLSETETPIYQVMENAPLQVYIVTRQRTYLKVTVDGQTVFDGRTLPGNAYPYSGSESIEILSGNAAALQILFNQNDLGTIGASGQVVNLIFTAQGVITPTPRFTSTSTPTTPATITLEPTSTPSTPTVTPMIP